MDGDGSVGAAGGVQGFDPEEHGEAAGDQYRRERSQYVAFADSLESIVNDSLRGLEAEVHSVQSRAKSVESLARKASEPSSEDAAKPKYEDPLTEITDLTGVRIITYFLRTVESVEEIVRDQFEVVERSDKSKLLEDAEKLGYRSVHYTVHLNENRTRLPEYSRFAGMTAEIQIRTILQHAWAEIEHDIQYKSVAVLPSETRRRFLSLAGLLEIADREFQAIQEQHGELIKEARASVSTGQLMGVEITADALKAYLDRRLGSDGRMANWNYAWLARLLLRLGFKNLEQVDECVNGLNDDRISRVLWGSRMGQIQRFEDMLLAAMGQMFLEKHIWSKDPGYMEAQGKKIERLRQGGIPVGSFDPTQDRERSDEPPSQREGSPGETVG